MAQAHVRKGDTVVVVAGKERGKRGKVLRVYPAEGRVLVERLNMMKKHQRPTQKLRQGGIIEREAPLHLSNVMLLDPRTDKPTRVGVRLLADGKKARIARKSGEIIDKA
ncbi:MAG: 50S ribosomal protein L24 [Candidatus Rokubacteria bacterium GWC2_70_16]|nr:MAG: 50S ribosomal protein L24 [Candidatus Rokubacteria bacterium GWC2_70_16]OGL19033.1 MAG: 50S ribosomal protein L24 [Candidatus Rokubacteria bacterium RIFCSPLOWO2_12_FULL_71_19]